MLILVYFVAKTISEWCTIYNFVYTYMTMTTTTKKLVDQFARITISSNDDINEPLVSVCTTISITFKTTAPRCYYGHNSKLHALNYLVVLSNSVSSHYITLGKTKTIERINAVLLCCPQFVSKLI